MTVYKVQSHRSNFNERDINNINTCMLFGSLVNRVHFPCDEVVSN